MIDWNVYTIAINKHLKTLTHEREEYIAIFKDTKTIESKSFIKNNMNYLSINNSNVIAYRNSEIQNQWKNRMKMLNDSIYRMKFVRIEFLSQMRNLAHNIPLSNTDKVSTYNAAPSRNNELAFPNDGDLWGDDLFNMRAAVTNLCLKGLDK